MTPIRIAIAGCTGRMGRAIVRQAAARPDIAVVAGLSIAADPLLGQDVGVVAGVDALGVRVTSDPSDPPDVLIEFTSPAGCTAWAAWCAERNVPLVSGSTGLDATHRDALHVAAKSTAILWSSNMSVGVNLLVALAAQVARTLDDDWDIEIVETHHNQKADAPSGTATTLLEAVAGARNLAPASVRRDGRSGTVGRRPRGEVGLHAVRMGGVVGDHDVHFARPGEVLTLRHHAESREIFAAGALHAARWLVGRPPGLYSMRDALGLS